MLLFFIFLDLISPENVSCINFLLYIIQGCIVAVGYDGLALCLESFQVVYDLAAEEGTSVFEGGFVDNHSCSLGLDAFHHSLNGALTEIVAAGFHGEAVNSDYGDF